MGFLQKDMDELVRQMQADRVMVKLPDLTEAHEAINDSIVDDLMGEIETGNLITWEHDSDGDRPNYDNLEEWLKMYYRLERK